jgi:hypothetical protein
VSATRLPSRNGLTELLCASALAALLSLSGCATAPIERPVPSASPLPSVELDDVPFFPQQRYQCGPAALATVLSYAGKPADPDRLAKRVYLPARRGSLQVELLGATRREGLIPYPIRPTLGEIVEELNAGRPVLVLQNLGVTVKPIWHYAVVIGRDRDGDNVILRSGTTRREVMPTGRFLRSWQRAGSWGFVVLAPGELPVRPDRERYLKAVAAVEAVGGYEDALRGYRAALRRWPNEPSAQLGIGNSHYGLGELEQAASAYRRLLEIEPGNLAGYNNLAQSLADQGRIDEAREVIALGLAVAPKHDRLVPLLRQTGAEIDRGR